MDKAGVGSKGDGGLIVPDAAFSANSITQAQEMVQLQMLESQVLHHYGRRNRTSNYPEVEWVRNTLDGSLLHDHKGYPISVNRLLATKPIRSELSCRPGPGGKKLTYLSGEGVTRTLNEIFGFDGWNMDIVKTQREECIRDDKGRFHVAYTAQVRLTHRQSGTYKEDVGASDSIDKIMGTAVAHALKGSITDALKRAARHFGEKLGNTLYQGNFSISKAPLTLKDALDQYDNERASTKLGASPMPTVSTSASANILLGGGEVNQATPAATKATGANTSMQQVASNNVVGSSMGHVNNNNTSAPNIATVPASMVTAAAKTPAQNPQMPSSTATPLVSATPAAKKVANHNESKESLSNRLGPPPKLNLPPASNHRTLASTVSSYNKNNGNDARSGVHPPPGYSTNDPSQRMHKPLSASDRLNQSNMFGQPVTAQNGNKENTIQLQQPPPQQQYQGVAVPALARPKSSHGRPSNSTKPTPTVSTNTNANSISELPAVEWTRHPVPNGLLKRPLANADSSNNNSSDATRPPPSKRVMGNANPYQKIQP